eukprot:GHVL01033709.1.p1 GENE.GHVL01033709.1~~GHVL01033709.1.p1  ORF type:complete len:1496 (+),score=226.00 GHVL01033709.1:443-4930(+)
MAIFDRLSDGQEESLKCYSEYSDQSAIKGYRTLVFAKRHLSAEEHNTYQLSYKRALGSLTGKKEQLLSLAEMIETDLTIVGCIKLEEKLQTGVPETVQKLIDAGIRMWMVTGDKKETAVTAARSSNMLTSDMILWNVTPSDIWGREKLLRASKKKHVCAVIDGKNLETLLEESPLRIAEIAILCRSVIVNRVTPAQKGQLISLIKKQIQPCPIILAVGDGSNDVPMIQVADVGVGLICRENVAVLAHQASDYAITHFTQLQRLLLVHGRQTYTRISFLILYCFFKNIILVVPQFIFLFFSQFSAQPLFDTYMIGLYHLTTIPAVAYGLLERDVPDSIAVLFPMLYMQGQMQKFFNLFTLFEWLCRCVFYSAVTIVAVAPINSSYPSLNTDFHCFGSSICLVLYITVSLNICFFINLWNTMFAIIISFSVLTFFPIVWLHTESGVSGPDTVGVGNRIFFSPQFWLGLFWAVTTVFLFEMTIKNLKSPSGMIQRTRYRQSKVFNMIQKTNDVSDLKRYFTFVKPTEREHTVISCKKDEKYAEIDKNDNLLIPISLRFRSAILERKFLRYNSTQMISRIRRSFVLMMVLTVLWAAYESVAITSVFNSINRFSAPPLLLSLWGFTFLNIYKKHFENYQSIIAVLGLFYKSGSDILQKDDGILSTMLVPVLTFTTLGIPYRFSVLVNGLNILLFCIRYYFFNKEALALVHYLPIVVGTTLFSGSVAYYLELYYRKTFILDSQLQSDRQRQRCILNIILPSFVVDYFVRHRTSVSYLRSVTEVHNITASLESVTVLFCGISDFTNIVSKVDPITLVQSLDGLFTIFDGLCDRFGVAKVETVSETYLAAGGLLPDGSESGDPAGDVLRSIQLALEMIDKVKGFSLDDMDLHVTIGIHTGPVIRGVVGSRKPQYSLFGDTVNTASRMKGTGKSDHVHVSKTTYDLLAYDDTYVWEPKKTMVKGKGEMETFLLISHSSLKLQPRKGLKKGRRQSDTGQVVNGFKLLQSGNVNVEEVSSPEKSLNTKNFLGLVLLTFEDKKHEEQFVRDRLERHFYCGRFETGLLIWMLTYICQTIETLIVVPSVNYLTLLGPRLSFLLIVFLYWMFATPRGVRFWKRKGQVNLKVKSLIMQTSILLVLYMIGTLMAVFQPLWTSITADRVSAYSYTIDVFFWISIVDFNSGLLFRHVLLVNLLINVLLTPVVVMSIPLKVELLSFSLIFSLLCGSAVYFKEYFDRLTFLLNIQAEWLEKNVNLLLSEMLPTQVLIELRSETLQVAYCYTDMCLLFSDICGFTAFARSVDASIVLTLLTGLFDHFDELTRVVGIYKVCTIGDAYVAVTEPTTEKRNQLEISQGCLKLLQLAEAMLEHILVVRDSLQIPNLGMRIGLHLGSFVGGVIGMKKLRFDIWGVDVLIGNLMEQHGVPGRIVVSSTVKEACETNIESHYKFDFHKEVLTVQDQTMISWLTYNEALPCRIPSQGELSHQIGNSLHNICSSHHIRSSNHTSQE